MRDYIHSYMKLGIVLPMAFPDGSILDNARKIAEDEFFGAIEVPSIPKDIRDDVTTC